MGRLARELRDEYAVHLQVGARARQFDMELVVVKANRPDA